MNLNLQKNIGLVVLFITTILTTNTSYATWSIIAIDYKTRQIGIVGASCTFDVSGITSIIPGKGAVVVQAVSDYFARMKGVELINKGMNLSDIPDVMKDERFNSEKQQYGLISLNKDFNPLVYS